MEISIQQSIDLNNFEAYLVKLKEGVDPFSRDEDGRTVLHAIAYMKDEGPVSRFFSRTKSSCDYFMEIRHYLIDDCVRKLTLQDKFGNTALHIAIRRENWRIATIIGNYLYRDSLHSNYRVNHDGVNEFQLALELYGSHGRSSEIAQIFPWENRA